MTQILMTNSSNFISLLVRLKVTWEPKGSLMLNILKFSLQKERATICCTLRKSNEIFKGKRALEDRGLPQANKTQLKHILA